MTGDKYFLSGQYSTITSASLIPGHKRNCSCVSVTKDGVRIGHLQVVTTNNDYTIANLHNLQSLHTNLLSLHYPFPGNGFITQEL
jgi:hypothetical protein